MLRPIYLTAMGACVGALTAAACGHAALWIGIGLALGLAWDHATRRASAPVGGRYQNRSVVPSSRSRSFRMVNMSPMLEVPIGI